MKDLSIISTRLLMQSIKLSCIALLCFVSACGYHLAGTVHSTPLAIQLNLDSSAKAIETRLTWRLQAHHISINPQSMNQVSLKQLQINEHRLSGLIAEVKITSSADATVQMAGQPAFNTQLYAERGYQYKLNTIETDAHQATILTEQMYDEIADQLVRIIISQHLRTQSISAP